MRSTPNLTALEVVSGLPTFTVASPGDPAELVGLTLQGAEQSFPFLSRLVLDLGLPALEAVPVESFGVNEATRASALALKKLFDHYGSDKANSHNYHHLYGAILHDPASITAVFEIGLGTNNADTPSNMTSFGRPGASLRAFRDYLPNAKVYGADVDKRVLFEEERINTFFVDQTNLQTIDDLSSRIDEQFDLIIDDGLHAPNANIAALIFGLKKLKRGGCFVVEDIQPAHLPVWQVVSSLLPGEFKAFLAAAQYGYLFAIQKVS